MANTDFINEMFGQYTGEKKYDKVGYHCNKCDYELDRIVVKTVVDASKKLFFCVNKNCERFGVLTVVAKTKNKL